MSSLENETDGQVEGASESSADGPGSDLQQAPEKSQMESPKRLTSVLCVVIGWFVLGFINWLGTGLVLSWALESSPEFKTVVQQFESDPEGYEPTEEIKENVSGVVRVLVGFLVGMVVLLPVIIGLVVGRLTGRKREAALIMVVGMSAQYLAEIRGLGTAILVLALVGIAVGVGSMGAALGAKWARAKT